MRRHQQLPSCISDHFTAAATTTPALAASSLHQQLPVLHQQIPASTFLHQQIPAATGFAPVTTSPEPAATFLHQQTPATISPETVTTFLHQQIPATTSPGPVTTFLYLQIPVLNQRPSSCISGNQSCTSNHLSNEYQSCTSYPDLLQQSPSGRGDCSPYTFFNLRFAIIKFGLSKQHPCFVILA